MLRKIAKNVFIPIAAGGGIDTLKKAREVLQCGADKIIINSAATKELIEDLSDEMGSQSVVVSIDHKDNGSTWSCHGTIQTGCDVTNHVKLMMRAGAGEILLNNIDQDGMMDGYNISILKEVVDAVTVPVTAMGGAGLQQHLKEALNVGAHGAAAGSLFCYQNRRTKKVLINYPPGLSFCRQYQKEEYKPKHSIAL